MFLGKLATQHGDGHVIFRSHFAGVFKQRARIFPTSQLDRGRRDQCHANSYSQALQNKLVLESLNGEPDQRNKQTDQGDIGVAVGPGLIAHLHQPNDRHECAEKPQPAHYEVGSLTDIFQPQHGDQSQQHDGANKVNVGM